ncbi:galactose-1-phosphate uridylyltransferase [Venenivibrio stagnispumantis]|uniref:UDPglucose--hexose-1-phosphate uridylyltransferase n=1 Tax=Venenivibrio stagnispumantis TaxID=407998 RepID=A0AA45WML6_9AQUI|nr:DUF4931 domain-containing protein [Venenivibrio stagnispumantis]MCW4573633.1 DUF4921 family protein [Venenivibrio stagnispumantis]SMP14265.1 UDPglucose--hexose-1-phosphate uridylyltransferase [Venenivibrio stagnispumantis]
MSEIRYNRLKNKWVIISIERSRRPHDYPVSVYEESSDVSKCPFEYGNEDKTPPEIFAIRPDGSLPNTPGWKVRVVPNKYPALRIENSNLPESEGIYDKYGGFGAHEVIIETPEHFKHIQDFSIEEYKNMYFTFRERMRALYQDIRIKYVHIFKNHGKEAGKSLVHSHSQLIATPIIPTLPDTQINQSRIYFQEKERCLLCDEIKEEIKSYNRVVYENDLFIAYCPYASLYPFEVRIAPKYHSHDFSMIDENQLLKLSEISQVVIKKLHKALVNPPFNMILHTSPPIRDYPAKPLYYNGIDRFYHWFIEILPRITTLAGFELGTDIYINPTIPEDAAKFLREVI